MKTNQISRYEHERIYYKGNKAELLDSEIKILERFNYVNGKLLFDFDRECIKLKQYVGVIQVQNKTIEILPKFGSGENQRKGSIRNLLHMLSYTHRLNLTQSDIAQLTKTNEEFLEIFVRLFLTNLKELIDRGFPRNYVAKSDNLTYLKGKINFTENVRYNVYRKDKIFCDYEEFCEDTLINRILKSTLILLKSRTNDNMNFRIILELLPLFEGISVGKISRMDFSRVSINRNNKQFEPLLSLSYQFLFGESIEMGAGKFNTYSFLFDMNQLFEEFIYEFMRKNRSEIGIVDIERQYKLGYLLQAKNNKPKFRLRPDIYIRTHDNEMLIDTKYKIINSLNDINNGDIYQMFAYGSKYLNAEDKEKINIILLYPKAFEHADEVFYSDNRDIQILPRYIDLLSINDLSSSNSKKLLIDELIILLGA